MSNDCTFKAHINNIIESAKRFSSWILRTFKTREKLPLITLFKSLGRPILEYGSVLWAPVAKGDIQRLEEVQQSFLRKINGVSRDYHKAIKELNMYSLERRRERYIIMQVWKMLENKVPDDLNIKLQSSINSRRGRTCLIHKLASTPSHLQKAKQRLLDVLA